ncbi:hypothetical protein, partial [Paraburkholderia caledonica]|uniref:hypothetical protein n=1 Tax=Paraburkholderia caledonica TaxID=134536 RepID=UPI0038BD21DE
FLVLAHGELRALVISLSASSLCEWPSRSTQAARLGMRAELFSVAARGGEFSGFTRPSEP